MLYYNYKLDEQAITNIIKRHIKPIGKQKQINKTLKTFQLTTSK